MRFKIMLNLNKTLYTLLVIFVLEVSMMGMVLLFDTLVDENFVAKKVIKIEKVQLQKVQPLEFKIVQLNKPIKILSSSKKKSEHKLRKISPKVFSDIIPITSSEVEPVVYTQSVKLSSLSIAQKKETFIDLMIPSILLAKHELKEERLKVKALLLEKELTAKESLWLTKKRYIFKASSNEDLYNKMELHPTSIVIAQAIIESGWGTSKFFEKANNVFGIWSFKTSEARMVAGKKRGDKRVYLKKYASVEQSIADYFLMLSTKEVYQSFREKRLETQDPFELIKCLTKYSELGDEYIENLKNTIQKNNLLAYDTYYLAF